MSTTTKRRFARAATSSDAANAARFHQPDAGAAVTPAAQHVPQITRTRRRPAGRADAHPDRALRDTAETFGTFMGPMHLAALVLARDGNVVYANPLLLELTGWNADDVFGRSWFDRFVEPPGDVCREAFADLLADDPAVAIYTTQVMKRDGGSCRVRWHNALIREGNEVVGTASIGELLDEDVPPPMPLSLMPELGPLGVVMMTRALIARPEETAMPFLRMIVEHCAQLADECGGASSGSEVARHIRQMFGLATHPQDATGR